ncbi:surface layer protein [Amycolatopsis saalfeldensis]|uniref:DNA-binding beta-propeller fold protein YncE n=1 Tax=Amycolatopsis saalfeldensis TaxID=394193 RepID=A0A1H8PR57_9PSEU|nr:surface layer protein [Amycolatopsis saalfeldensis]SEO44405.1 DNA-binding beta-propeller fold protein YncE [Amycolatopsis saalfeldensis]
MSHPRVGDRLAVVSQSGPTVTLFDAVGHRAETVLTLPAEPHELCFDAEHRLLYCTSSYTSGYYGHNAGRNHLLTVIAPDDGRIVEVIDLSPEHGPHGMALDPARRLLYVSVEAGPAGPGGVVVLDTTTREVLRRINTLAPGPHWFVIDPDGRLGYAANKEAPFVTVVELATGELIGKIPVSGSEGIAVSPDGSTVAVAAQKADFTRPAVDPSLVLIDTRTGAIVRTLPTEHSVVPVHWTADGVLLAGEVRIAAGTGDVFGPRVPHGRLVVWAGPSAAEVERVGTAEVGSMPLTLTSSPDGGRAYLAAVGASTVGVVDLADPARPTVVDTLDVARAGEPGAHGLAYLTGA